MLLDAPDPVTPADVSGATDAVISRLEIIIEKLGMLAPSPLAEIEPMELREYVPARYGVWVACPDFPDSAQWLAAEPTGLLVAYDSEAVAEAHAAAWNGANRFGTIARAKRFGMESTDGDTR